jgi:hypothetical protein
MVALTYCLGWKDHSSKPAGIKMFARLHLNKKKAEHVGTYLSSSNSRKLKIGGSWFRPAWAKSKALSLQ